MSNFLGVSFKSIFHNDSTYTALLASGITEADEGKAVSIGTVSNTVKLAADGDVILGVLMRVENRVTEGVRVGTICTAGSTSFPVKAGLTGDAVPGVGKYLVGAGSGEVKAQLAASRWLVMQGSATEAIALQI